MDTGARGGNYVTPRAAQIICEKENLAMIELPRKKLIGAFNGERAKPITHAIYPRLQIQGHGDRQSCLYVTEIEHHDIIIGKAWQVRHDCQFDMGAEAVYFKDRLCRSSRGICEHLHAPRPLPSPQTRPPIDTMEPMGQPSLDVRHIGIQEFDETIRACSPRIFSIALDELMDTERCCELGAVSSEDIAREREKTKEAEVRPELVVPKAYHSYLDVFSKEAADELPNHSESDHHITLTEDPGTRISPLYSMSRDELELVQNYISDNLSKGFIVNSTAQFASPVLFVRKPGGGLRFCVDYRKLNSITKKDPYPLPLIEETLSQISEAKVLTKLDIRHAFNRIRMATEEDEDLTTFRTRFGAYKYKVMPFGLCNGPATFQRHINKVLWDCLGKYVVVYMDDILIYSRDEQEHELQVKTVLGKLRKAGLQADVKKCEFSVTETAFLGVILGVHGMRMNPEKIKAIVEWGDLKNEKEILAFLGLCGFYRRFIEGFSRIAKPLTELTKKDVPFVWGAPQAEAFNKLKRAMTEAPALRHFDPKREAYVECDASDYVVAGILSQKDDEGVLHPVAYYSTKMIPAECNYEIYDKELLAIVRCFEAWRPELEGAREMTQVLTDHRNLEHFMTTKKLTRRQARWAELLSQYNFKVTYRPGKQNAKADTLTRRARDTPQEEEDERHQYQKQTIITRERIDPAVWEDMKDRLCAAHPMEEDPPEDASPSRSEQGTEAHQPKRKGKRRTKKPRTPRAWEHQEEDSDENIGEERQLPKSSTRDSPNPAVGTHARFQARVNDESREDEDIVDVMPEGDPEHKPLTEWIVEAQRDDGLTSKIIQAVESKDRHMTGVPLASCEVRDGALLYKEKYWIPENGELRLKILREVHDQASAGHPGVARTLAFLKRQFYWPAMEQTVSRYVANCHICRRSKAPRDGYHGLLSPLPIPNRPWEHIAMDFVTGLPMCGEYNAILMVICRLSKRRHLIPCFSGEEGTTSIATAELLLKHVWKDVGLPVSMVSDRGPQFVSKTWGHLCSVLGIKRMLSTAAHPETDGQSEIANAEMERYLRSYVNFQQDDWVRWLPMAEFAINSAVSETTKVAPFLATLGYEPRMSFEAVERAVHPRNRMDEQTAMKFVSNMKRLWEHLQDNMGLAQSRMETQANKSRKPTPNYQPGDQVWLSTKNLRTTRPTRKLDYRQVGPYEILKKIGTSSYELKLPSELAIHPVFHSSLLRLDPNNPLEGQIPPPPPPIIVTGDHETDEWEVETVLDSKVIRGKLKYKVQWVGYPPDNKWYDSSNFGNAAEKTNDFHTKYPTKPRSVPLVTTSS